MNDKAQNQRLRDRRRVTVILAISLSALAAGGALYCSRHTVPPERLSRVKPGMIKDEVIQLLGPPSSTSLQSDGLTLLAYRKHDRWCMVDLFLDADGRVRSVFHDH